MKSTTATTFQFRLSTSSVYYSLAVVPVSFGSKFYRSLASLVDAHSRSPSSPARLSIISSAASFQRFLPSVPFFVFFNTTQTNTRTQTRKSPRRCNKHVSHLPQDVRHRPRRPVYPLPRSCPRPRRNLFSLFLHHRNRHPILRLNLFAHRIRTNYLPLAHRHPSSHHLDFVLDFSFGFRYCCRALSLSFSLDFGFCNVNYNWDYTKEYSYPDVRFYLYRYFRRWVRYIWRLDILSSRSSLAGPCMVFVAGAFFHNFLRRHFQERDIQGGSI